MQFTISFFAVQTNARKGVCEKHESGAWWEVIAQTEVSKEKLIAVVNATKTASLGNMYSAITTTLETNDRSLSDSESDNE